MTKSKAWQYGRNYWTGRPTWAWGEWTIARWGQRGSYQYRLFRAQGVWGDCPTLTDAKKTAAEVMKGEGRS